MRTRSSTRKPVNRVGPDYPAAEDRSHRNPQKRKTGGRKKAETCRLQNLNTLGELPLDILLEIFKLLHPGDLVTLALVSKSFHAALRMDHAKAVWKQARESVELPEPLEGMSEMQFAWLIFNSWCMICASEDDATVDFMLRRRLCNKCKKHNVIKEYEFTKAFPKLDRSILSLLVPTQGLGFYTSCYWWKADIEWMAEKLESITAGAASSGGNAPDALTSFTEARRELAAKMLDDATELTESYNSWVYYERERERDEAQRAERQRTQERHQLIIERFVGLGYNPCDIKLEWIISREKYEEDLTLIDKVWANIRKALEPQIKEAESARREREDKVERDARRQIFDDLYREYHLTVDPSQWRFMPSASTLRQLPVFRDLVELPINHVVTKDSFAEAMVNLDTMIATITEKKKSDMLERISFVAFTEGVPRSISRAGPLHLLECVILAHRCGSCHQAVFGWEELSSHHCCAIADPVFCPNSVVTQAAVKVVRATHLPLHPDTTVAQMDALDPVYVCISCTPVNRHRSKATAYKWRDCATHLAARHEFSLETVKIVILSHAETEIISEQIVNMNLVHGPQSRWACTHCAAHIPDGVAYDGAIQHVMGVHGIRTPSESVDLVNIIRRLPPFAIEYQPVII